jgi:hypothetical protein
MHYLVDQDLVHVLVAIDEDAFRVQVGHAGVHVFGTQYSVSISVYFGGHAPLATE